VKIGDLVQRTQVTKETVHYYIREGLLPKPRKLGRNVAEYDAHFVERIRLIKELQDQYYLPLAVIGNILKNQKKSPEGKSILSLRREYFQPVDHLLPKEVVGEEAFLAATRLGKNWLGKMEKWGIINPEVINGRKVYSQDDITIGKLIVKMDKIGIGVRNGFNPEALKHYRDLFREIVVMSHKYYMEGALGKITPDEFSKRMLQGREVLSVFFYHLYRKLSREEYKRILSHMVDKGNTPEEKGNRGPGKTRISPQRRVTKINTKQNEEDV
jgi:DNA-binding transcriptional MerR regulator